jgi:hypothetical protein
MRGLIDRVDRRRAIVTIVGGVGAYATGILDPISHIQAIVGTTYSADNPVLESTIAPALIEPTSTPKPTAEPTAVVPTTIPSTQVPARPTEIVRPVESIPNFEIPSDPVFRARKLISETSNRLGNLRRVESTKLTPEQVKAADLNQIYRMAIFCQQFSNLRSELTTVRLVASDELVIDGKPYKLVDPNDRIYAAALMETVIGEAFNIDDNKRDYRERRETIKSLYPTVMFGSFSDIQSLLPSETFTHLSPLVKALKDKGKTIPPVWFGYVNNKYENGKLFFDFESPAGALADYYYYTEKPTWSVLSKRLDQLVGDSYKGLAEEDTVISKAIKDRNWELVIRKSCYEYLTNGHDFRSWIFYYAHKHDVPSHSVLSTLYDGLQQFFGFETINGELLKTDEKFEVGTKAEVWDRQGINIRQWDEADEEFTSKKIPDKIQKGTTVSILDSTSKTFIQHHLRRAYRMVHIKRYLKPNDSNNVEEEGWVASEFLIPLN